MTVHIKTTETDDTIVSHWESSRIGEVVENAAGVGSTHPTILIEGKVRLDIDGQRPEEFEAPHTITLPIKTPYTFTALTSRIAVNCIYSKKTGAADEIRHLVTNDERRVYMD